MEKTRSLRDHLRIWLARHQQARGVAPAIREALDEAEWRLGVLRDRPTEAMSISTAPISEEAGLALGRIKQVMPQTPEYGRSLGFQIGSISTHSIAAALSYLRTVGDIDTQATRLYSQGKAEDYRRLQESHQRHARVRALVAERVPGSLARFDAALTAVGQRRSGALAKSAAASELRALVEGVHGELLEKVRRWPKERLSWPFMVEKLFQDPTCAAVMREQAGVSAALCHELSQATTLREGPREQRMVDLAMSVLDHLLVVLSLVKSTDVD